MAEVTGPISSLPGSHHAVPDGTACDYHPDRAAVTRLQGETDSFGSEMEDLCEECWRARKREEAADDFNSGECDWCKKEATDLRWRRDYDEGLSGPVYRVCGGCVVREEQRLKEEAARYDDYYEPYGDEE